MCGGSGGPGYGGSLSELEHSMVCVCATLDTYERLKFMQNAKVK
jgi:hypothetical protein